MKKRSLYPEWVVKVNTLTRNKNQAIQNVSYNQEFVITKLALSEVYNILKIEVGYLNIYPGTKKVQFLVHKQCRKSVYTPFIFIYYIHSVADSVYQVYEVFLHSNCEVVK